MGGLAAGERDEMSVLHHARQVQQECPETAQPPWDHPARRPANLRSSAVLALQRSAGNHAVCHVLLQRRASTPAAARGLGDDARERAQPQPQPEGVTAQAQTAGPTPTPTEGQEVDGDPPPAPPSTTVTTEVSNQPLPAGLDAALPEAGPTGAPQSGGQGSGSASPGTAIAPPGDAPAPAGTQAPRTSGSGTPSAAPASAAGRTDLPETDPSAQVAVSEQYGPVVVAGFSRDYVPFSLGATLGFPSTWALRDWRYHAARTGSVRWWEHLDVLGAPTLGVGVGTSLIKEVHLQPSVAFSIIQYHMTAGSGANQLDNDITLAAIVQPDINLRTDSTGVPLLGQAGWTRTQGGTSFFQVWVQGGYDPVGRSWSGVLGISMGLEWPVPPGK